MSQMRALSLTAFLTLLLIGLMMGSNHVAARVAFGSGLDVATAVAVRSGVTGCVVGLLAIWAKAPWRLTPQQTRGLLRIGLMIGVQSQLLYGAVSRLPVALALLAFNTYPLWATLWNRLLYQQRPERQVLIAMPGIL